MLRNMMLDLNTMGENTFMPVMSKFYNDFKGKRASTDDFRRTIEGMTGVDLRWYFDQWVYGNELPTYTVAWKKEKQLDGKWKVTMRVRQTEVSSTFRMLIPVKITMDNKKVSRVRMLMTGPELTVELPIYDSEPDDLTFNDLHSVLCTVNTESF